VADCKWVDYILEAPCFPRAACVHHLTRRRLCSTAADNEHVIAWLASHRDTKRSASHPPTTPTRTRRESLGEEVEEEEEEEEDEGRMKSRDVRSSAVGVCVSLLSLPWVHSARWECDLAKVRLRRILRRPPAVVGTQQRR